MVVVFSARFRLVVIAIVAMTAYWLMNEEILQRRLLGNAVVFAIAVAAFVVLTAVLVATRALVVLLAWGVLIPLISAPLGYLAAEIGLFITQGKWASQGPAYSWIAIAFVFPFVTCKLWSLSVLMPVLILLNQGIQTLMAKSSGQSKGATGL